MKLKFFLSFALGLSIAINIGFYRERQQILKDNGEIVATVEDTWIAKYRDCLQDRSELSFALSNRKNTDPNNFVWSYNPQSWGYFVEQDRERKTRYITIPNFSFSHNDQINQCTRKEGELEVYTSPCVVPHTYEFNYNTEDK